MEEALIARLLASAGLTALVGTRIRPAVLAQADTYPAMVINVITDGDDYTHDGVSSLKETRVQFDAYGLTYLSAKQVARQIKAAMRGRFTQGAVTFSQVFFDGGNDTYEEKTPRLYRTRLDARVWTK